MDKLSTKFWDFFQKAEKWKIIVFVFTGSFILRLPTIFMDYIHVDVVTSYLLVKRDLAGLDFSPNKGWLYHFLYKFSVIFLGDTPAVFHFTGIILLLFTLVFIYLLGKKIYNERIGLIGAMFYGFLISSFNTEYLATNGEVIYNLFFVASFFFFYMVIFEKKYIYIIPLLAALIAGLYVKFQASYSIIALLFFLIFIWPVWFFKKKTSLLRYYIITGVILITLLCLAVLDWNSMQIFFTDRIQMKFISMKNYVFNRGFDPLLIISKLLWRGFQFTLYHSILWIPGIIKIIKYFKSDNKDAKQAYVIFLTVFLFATLFLGGARLSVHYFIPVLPVLAILSASCVYKFVSESRQRKLLFNIFIIPVLFFFLWNVKDVYVRNFNPDLKHNESRAMFMFRLIALQSQGEYLLPHKSLLPVVDFLRNETDEKSKIMIWPMGTEVAYYSKRETVEDKYWYNEKALYTIVRNENGDTEYLHNYENSFIRKIHKLKPDYFVDVGSTKMIKKILLYKKKDDPLFYFDINEVPPIRFGSFGSLDNFPEIITYLNKNYKFTGSFNRARVWEKK